MWTIGPMILCSMPWLATAGSPVSEPGKVITLPQALHLAHSKNFDLRTFSLEIMARDALVTQSGRVPNPEIELETSEFAGDGSRAAFGGSETSVVLSQTVLMGGKREAATRAAELRHQLAQSDYEAKRLDLVADVTKAFVRVLSAQERVVLEEELVDISRQVLNTVSEKVLAGKVSPLEKTKAKVTLSTVKLGLEQTKLELAATRIYLASFWGDTEPSFERGDGELSILSKKPTIDDLVANLIRNPDVARGVVENEHGRSLLRIEQARRVPDLTVRGGYQHFNDSNERAFVLGVSIPLMVFNRNAGNISAAGSRAIAVENTQEAIRLALIAKVKGLFQRFDSTHLNATTLEQEVIPAAELAFNVASEGYREGKFAFLEVLDAQRTLFQTRIAYIEVLSSYHQLLADINRLTGAELSAAGAGALNSKGEGNE